MNYTATIRDPTTPQPELFSLEEEPGGARPDRLFGVRPQAQVLRRTVQQIVDPVPSLPAVDDPAPKMVEQLPDILRFFRALSPDPHQVIELTNILPVDFDTQKPVVQVIAVPKITKDLIQPRLVACDQHYPPLAEQLVEVPTIVSFSSLQRTVEQNVDIPIVGGSGARGGLSGFLPGLYDCRADR